MLNQIFVKRNLTVLIFVVLVYILIYLVRLQQGGFQFEISLFKTERQSIVDRIDLLLPEYQAKLLSGILLGVKTDLPPELKIALRDTSTIHIAVVSGQNLTLLAGFFLSMAVFLKRRVAIILSLVAIVFYTLLTGAEVPVLRAAFMATLAYLAQIFGREKDGVWILVITAGVMLWINPYWISEISFQLSFLATLGVVVVSPLILDKLKSLPNLISQDLSISLSAQIMVTPIIVSNFHQFSILGLITNVMVLWTVPFIMIIGALMVVFSYIFVPLAVIFALLTNIFLVYFIYIVEFFSSFNYSWIYIGNVSVLAWIGYYIILLGFLIWIKKQSR